MIFLGRLKRILVVVNGLLVVVVVLVFATFQTKVERKGLTRQQLRVRRGLPGDFLVDEKPSNASFCNFLYDLPVQLRYNESDVVWTPGGRYRVLYNALKGDEDDDDDVSVTYATHLTPEFLPYLVEVVRVWEGPVSVAAFTPSTDAFLLIEQMIRMCHCWSGMSRVSVHLVFPQELPPQIGYDELSFKKESCALPFMDSIVTFRMRTRQPYPVNACRNVARVASTTPFHLVSDVELIPSVQLVSRFHRIVRPFHPSHREVYVVPVFEVDKDENIPQTKKELIELVHAEKATYFHRHICLHCQKFPGIEFWLMENPRDVVKVFKTTTRTYPYHRWEPIFIGSKNDPLYKEDMTWEGKQDKMIQMLEMCLIGYRFLILDGAFLVHWPGIKRNNRELRKINKWRIPYEMTNSRQYTNTSKYLHKQYVNGNKKCKA